MSISASASPARLLAISLLSIGLYACGGGGSSPTSSTSSNPVAGGGQTDPGTDPGTDPAPQPTGAPLRFSGTAPEVDTVGPFATSGPVDYQYEAVMATQNIIEDRESDELHTTTSQFGTEVDVLGVIFYPTVSDANPAPAEGFPVVLFQHGRHSTCSDTGEDGGSESSGTDCEEDGLVPIRSDKGYDYIAETLASHGYVVMSIDVNDINAQDAGSNDQGITARAELILHHLDIFRDIDNRGANSAFASDTLGNDFATALAGNIDLSRIGIMGHSRGGNGVAKTITYNMDERFRGDAGEFTAMHDIIAVFSLAPTDFNSELPLNTTWATLSPYCDGDVSTLHGVYMYDNIRYNELDTRKPQYQLTTMGANHNFYNNFWFNDDAVLNGADPYCTADSPTSGRFSRPDQNRHGEFLIGSFMRLFVGGETQFAGYWNGKERLPTSACPVGDETCDERVHLAFHQSPENRITVDTTLTDESLTTNTLGLSNQFSNFTQTGWCDTNGGSLEDTTGFETDRCPSPASISKAPQLFARWSALTPTATFSLSDTGLDVSTMDFFSVRMGVVVTQENALGQDFTLTLVDANGVEAQALASDYSDALYFPPGLTASARDTGAKTIMNMVPFRLDAEPWVDSGIDFTQLIEARISFDQTNAGTVQFTDVQFQKVD